MLSHSIRISTIFCDHYLFPLFNYIYLSVLINFFLYFIFIEEALEHLKNISISYLYHFHIKKLADTIFKKLPFIPISFYKCYFSCHLDQR